jgi:hypothetical protein
MATGIQGPQGFKGARGVQGATGWGAIGSETGPTGPTGPMGTFTTLTSASGATLQLVDAAISTLYRHDRNSDIELRHGATAAGGYWVFYNPATSNRTLTPSTVTNPMSITTSSGPVGSLTLTPNKSVTLRYVSGSNYITL